MSAGRCQRTVSPGWAIRRAAAAAVITAAPAVLALSSLPHPRTQATGINSRRHTSILACHNLKTTGHRARVVIMQSSAASRPVQHRTDQPRAIVPNLGVSDAPRTGTGDPYHPRYASTRNPRGVRVGGLGVVHVGIASRQPPPRRGVGPLETAVTASASHRRAPRPSGPAPRGAGRAPGGPGTGISATGSSVKSSEKSAIDQVGVHGFPRGPARQCDHSTCAGEPSAVRPLNCHPSPATATPPVSTRALAAVYSAIVACRSGGLRQC